jgi:integrase
VFRLDRGRRRDSWRKWGNRFSAERTGKRLTGANRLTRQRFGPSATLLLAAGEHPKIAQELLGHSNIAMTLGTYSHILPTMQRQAIDRLGAMLSTAAG